MRVWEAPHNEGSSYIKARRNKSFLPEGRLGKQILRSRICDHDHHIFTFSIYDRFHVEDLEDILQNPRWTRGGQSKDRYVGEELS